MPQAQAILISASAGSGKTFRLTKKYIELLLAGEEISSLLAITFTDNAANEMKDRIIEYLKAIAFEEKDKIEKFNLPLESKRAISILDKIFENYNWFNIKTIDSFITSIFSFSYDNFKYRDDLSIKFNYKSIVKQEIFKFLLTKIINNDVEQINSFISLVNETKNKIVFDPIKNIIEYFSEFFKKEDDYLSDIKKISRLQKKNLLNKINFLRIEILKSIEKIREEDVDLIYSDIKKGKEIKDSDLIAKTIINKEGLIKKNIPIKKQVSELKKIELKLNTLAKRILSTKAKLFYIPYIELYCQFRDYLRNNQKKSKVIILSSMYREINKMLKESNNFWINELYMKLSSQFTHFFIDEFQDTSYAQWNLIRPFIEEAFSRGGSLFLIGDIKQAIYMFRNADWRIMMDMIKRPKSTFYLNTSTLDKGIEVVNVELNYRSSDVILNYVNEFFKNNCFVKYLNENNLSHFKSIYQITHISDKKKEGYVETKIVDENKAREVFIEIIKDILLRFNLSSIAILSYKNETLAQIAQWLDEEKIPVLLYGELDIRKNKTIQSIISLLRFIKNQKDEFNFSMFLLSPIFIKKLDKDSSKKIINFFISTRSNRLDLFKEEFRNLWYETIYRIINESTKKDIYSLINTIISEFDIIKNFPHDNAFIIKFVDLLHELREEEKIYSIVDLINFIDKADEDDERFSVEISPTINAIKLMTFHKSKGLEFDVVVNIFNQTNLSGNRIYYDFDGKNINLYNINQESSKSDTNLNKIYKLALENDRISDINTLYVALTRAKFELYNIIINKPRNLKILNLFENTVRGKKIKDINKTKENKVKAQEFEAKISRDKSLVDIVNVKTFSKEIEIGNVFHKAISLITSKKMDIEKSIKYAFLNENVVYNEDTVKKVKDLIVRTLKNPKIRNLLESKCEIKSEIEFSDKDGNIMRADLVIFEKNRINIIDFKTGNYNIEDKNQILGYISSVKKIYKSYKVVGIIYYVEHDKIYEYNT
ncbi:MAG: UvrD-helicase domain-containing protein [Elusimicrobiales bacterium]|nr:UvrD-helicase domain-containing protein [Elusimicrobiales bacterium]